MANLKQFIAPASRSNMPLDLYLNRWPKIGDGSFVIVEELRVVAEGTVNVLGQEFKGKIEIVMPDLSPRGVCTVALNGDAQECNYQVVGNTLEINHPSRKITLQANDRHWSWVNVSGVGWIGLWPKGLAASDEVFFGAPGSAGAIA